MPRICLVVASMFGALLAAHDPTDAHAEAAESRRVKGHVFQAPVLQETAFVTTHVGIREGVATYDVPDLPLGAIGTRDVTLSGIRQSLDLGLGITEWLGVFGLGRAVVITGADRTSLVVDGASVDFGGNLGVVLRVLENEHSGTQIALRARVGAATGRDITVQPLVLAVIEAANATVADVSDGDLGRLIIVPTSETSVSAGAHAAQFINRYLSAQASVSFERAWKTQEPFVPTLDRRSPYDADVLRMQLAAAVELDFSPLSAPIALLAEYMYLLGERTQERRPDTDLSTNSIGLGIYYVGRPNLQLGVSGATTLDAEPRNGIGADGEDELSGAPTLTYVDLILRYVW